MIPSLTTQKEEEMKTVKTTVILPEDLWLKVKTRAAEERSSLRQVIIDALKKHLKSKQRRKS